MEEAIKTTTLNQTLDALAVLGGRATLRQVAAQLGISSQATHERLTALVRDGGATVAPGSRRCDPSIYTATPGWVRPCECKGVAA